MLPASPSGYAPGDRMVGGQSRWGTDGWLSEVNAPEGDFKTKVISVACIVLQTDRVVVIVSNKRH